MKQKPKTKTKPKPKHDNLDYLVDAECYIGYALKSLSCIKKRSLPTKMHKVGLEVIFRVLEMAEDWTHKLIMES